MRRKRIEGIAAVSGLFLVCYHLLTGWSTLDDGWRFLFDVDGDWRASDTLIYSSADLWNMHAGVNNLLAIIGGTGIFISGTYGRLRESFGFRGRRDRLLYGFSIAAGLVGIGLCASHYKNIGIWLFIFGVCVSIGVAGAKQSEKVSGSPVED